MPRKHEVNEGIYGWDCLGCENCNPAPQEYLPPVDWCEHCKWDAQAYALDRSYDHHEEARLGW